MCGVVLLVGWALWSLPAWSRPGTFFSVTVVPSFRESPEANRILRGYRMEIAAHLVIALALIVAAAERRAAVLLVFSVLWLVVGPLIAISRGHAKAMPHAVAHSTIREASLAPRSIHNCLADGCCNRRPSRYCCWPRPIYRRTGSRFRIASRCIGASTAGRTAGRCERRWECTARCASVREWWR